MNLLYDLLLDMQQDRADMADETELAGPRVAWPAYNVIIIERRRSTASLDERALGARIATARRVLRETVEA